MIDFDAANKPQADYAMVTTEDPAQLVSKLDAFRSRISEMHNTAAAHTVTDDHTNEEAVRALTTYNRRLIGTFHNKPLKS